MNPSIENIRFIYNKIYNVSRDTAKTLDIKKVLDAQWKPSLDDLDDYNNFSENMIKNVPDSKLGVWFYETQIQNKEHTFTNQALSANYIVVPYYSENIDKTMKFLDWIFVEQANHDLFCYGIEGEDWKDAGDKTMENLSPNNAYMFPGYELCWNPEYTRINASWPKEM